MDVTALTKLKQTYFGGNKDNLLRELSDFVSDAETCKKRKNEINILVELDQYHDGAQIMLHMRDVFNLEGDFSDLEKVAQAVCTIESFIGKICLLFTPYLFC